MQQLSLARIKSTMGAIYRGLTQPPKEQVDDYVDPWDGLQFEVTKITGHVSNIKFMTIDRYLESGDFKSGKSKLTIRLPEPHVPFKEMNEEDLKNYLAYRDECKKLWIERGKALKLKVKGYDDHVVLSRYSLNLDYDKPKLPKGTVRTTVRIFSDEGKKRILATAQLFKKIDKEKAVAKATGPKIKKTVLKPFTNLKILRSLRREKTNGVQAQ